MATTQAEFQQVATDLKIEFADFFKPAIFTKLGDYDPLTGETVGDIEFTVDALREDYAAGQIDGQSIQYNDFSLLILADEFTVAQPTVDDLRLEFNGKSALTVVHGALDAANAVWTLQVRG